MDHFVSVDKLPQDFNDPRRPRRPPPFRSPGEEAVLPRLHEQGRLRPPLPAYQGLAVQRKLEDLFQVCIDNDDDAVKPTRGFFSLFRHRAVPS